MNPKIEKIKAEYAKNSAKIAHLTERNEKLRKQRIELENTDIIGMVREVGLTPEQLAALIQSGTPVAAGLVEATQETAEPRTAAQEAGETRDSDAPPEENEYGED